MSQVIRMLYRPEKVEWSDNLQEKQQRLEETVRNALFCVPEIYFLFYPVNYFMIPWMGTTDAMCVRPDWVEISFVTVEEIYIGCQGWKKCNRLLISPLFFLKGTLSFCCSIIFEQLMHWFVNVFGLGWRDQGSRSGVESKRASRVPGDT